MKTITAMLVGALAALAFGASASAGTEGPPTIDGPATVEASTPPLPEACIQHVTGGPDLPEGQYVEFDYDSTDPGITGSTRWGLFPCKPIPAVEPTIAPAATEPARTALPATGLAETLFVGFGVLLVSAGILLTMWVRQK